MNDTYRTRDGRAFFEFGFVSHGGFFTGEWWEVDIVSMPSYGMRDESLHATHRLPSARGGYRICFGDERSVNSLETARRFAKAWAEETWKYIRFGETFG